MSSTSPTLGTWDYVAGSIVIAVTMGTALCKMAMAKKPTNMKDFLVKSNDLNILTLILSAAATQISAIGFLGGSAETYKSGISFFAHALGPLLAIPMGIFFHLPVFHDLEISSIFQYLELRFNRGVRLCASILVSLQMVLHTAVVMYAPALALNQVTGLNLWVSIASIGVICIIYTSLGGIKAVIWADAAQCIVMVAVVFAVVVKGLFDLGGPGEVWRIGEEGKRTQVFVFSDSPYVQYSTWANMVGGGFHFLGQFGVNQQNMQRHLSNRTLRKARISMAGGLMTSAFLLLLASACGFIMYARYHACDPVFSGQVTARDQILALFAMDILGMYEGLPGIFAAAILCATLSSLSSYFNSLSAISMEDYIIPTHPDLSDKTKIILSRVIAAAYGFLCLGSVFLVQNLDGVIPANIVVNGVIGGPVIALFTVGMALPWVNTWGAMSGFFVGMLVTGWAAIGNLIVRPAVSHAPYGTGSCNISLGITNFNQSETLGIYSDFVSKMASSTQTNLQGSEPAAFALYSVPSIWYTSWSIGIGLVVSLLISILTGYQKPDELDQRLLFPSTRKLCSLLPKKYQKLLRCEPTKSSYIQVPNSEPVKSITEHEKTRYTSNDNLEKKFGIEPKLDEEHISMRGFQFKE